MSFGGDMLNNSNFFSQLKKTQPDSTSSSSDIVSPEVAKHTNKRLNFENVKLETMESQLFYLMVEINHHFDALQVSLALKDDTDKMESNFKAQIYNLATTFVKKTDSS